MDNQNRYYLAVAIDELYTEVLRQEGFRSRWDPHADRNTRVRVVLQAKIAADERWLRIMRESRGGR